MASLATEADTWRQWKNSFPQILDVQESPKTD